MRELLADVKPCLLDLVMPMLDRELAGAVLVIPPPAAEWYARVRSETASRLAVEVERAFAPLPVRVSVEIPDAPGGSLGADVLFDDPDCDPGAGTVDALCRAAVLVVSERLPAASRAAKRLADGRHHAGPFG